MRSACALNAGLNNLAPTLEPDHYAAHALAAVGIIINDEFVRCVQCSNQSMAYHDIHKDLPIHMISNYVLLSHKLLITIDPWITAISCWSELPTVFKQSFHGHPECLCITIM